MSNWAAFDLGFHAQPPSVTLEACESIENLTFPFVGIFRIVKTSEKFHEEVDSRLFLARSFQPTSENYTSCDPRKANKAHRNIIVT